MKYELTTLDGKVRKVDVTDSMSLKILIELWRVTGYRRAKEEQPEQSKKENNKTRRPIYSHFPTR